MKRCSERLEKCRDVGNIIYNLGLSVWITFAARTPFYRQFSERPHRLAAVSVLRAAPDAPFPVSSERPLQPPTALEEPDCFNW